jgi:hypothetical protein
MSDKLSHNHAQDSYVECLEAGFVTNKVYYRVGNQTPRG